jgi:molecular chaperone IbpA
LTSSTRAFGSSLRKYPPYDIIRTGEDTFRISLAVAGFDPSDITVTEQQNILTVAGRRSEGKVASDDQYLYRGISGRPFERRFTLSDYVVVKGATFDNGLLQIDLVRELSDAMKPRRIEIETGKVIPPPDKGKVIEHKPKAA